MEPFSDGLAAFYGRWFSWFLVIGAPVVVAGQSCCFGVTESCGDVDQRVGNLAYLVQTASLHDWPLVDVDWVVALVAYAFFDALAWHAGDWNGYGPGIEVEFLPGEDDSIFTSESLASTGSLVRWLHDEWGFPLEYYDGPRIDPVWDGFIAHRSLLGGDHTDWWPREDWDQMVSGAPAKKDMNDMVIAVGKTVFGVSVAFLTSGGRVLKTFDGAEGGYGIPQSALDWKAGAGRDAVPFVFVDPETVGKLAADWPQAGGSVGVLSDKDVARIASATADLLHQRLKQ